MPKSQHTAKPVIPRLLANQDVDDALSYYLCEGSEQAASGLVDALELAYSHIGRNPAIGSPRYVQSLNLPDLRFWPLSRFPYLVSIGNRATTLMCGACCMPIQISQHGCNYLTASLSKTLRPSAA